MFQFPPLCNGCVIKHKIRRYAIICLANIPATVLIIATALLFTEHEMKERWTGNRFTMHMFWVLYLQLY